jgi:hypothetical protein
LFWIISLCITIVWDLLLFIRIYLLRMMVTRNATTMHYALHQRERTLEGFKLVGKTYYDQYIIRRVNNWVFSMIDRSFSFSLSLLG